MESASVESDECRSESRDEDHPERDPGRHVANHSDKHDVQDAERAPVVEKVEEAVASEHRIHRERDLEGAEGVDPGLTAVGAICAPWSWG